ncbi:MAG: hypothetical protein B9S33_21405 [Pedosphaera sp. Tous-C6FEB]|nr:MAG: hypothetical protein B9S33_21405 [Pedosphaera sp. Tous-C6FEB]
MNTNLVLSLPPNVGEELLCEAAACGQSAEQFVADLLHRRRAVRRFEELSKAVEPRARAAGLTDENEILRGIS